MTEQTTTFGKISGEVLENTGEKFKHSLKLELVQDNIFTGLQDKFEVKLTESETVGESDYKADKLEKAFDTISEKTGVELKVPKKISVAEIKKAIKPVVGQSIEVFIGEAEQKDSKGNIQGTIRYHSLYEGQEITYLRSNASISELMDYRTDLKDNVKFLVKPVGFSMEQNTKYFDGNNNAHDAEMVEGTETRKGLATAIFNILKKDGKQDVSPELQQQLTDYMNQAKDAEGNFIGTTSGILKSVGVFTSKNFLAKRLEPTTVFLLASLLDAQQTTGRAWTASLRLIFSVNGAPSDKLFKTRALKEAPYDKKGEIFAATFNPKDTNFREFSKFIQPLYETGAMTQEDVAAIRETTKWHEIVNKIEEVIEREGLYAEVSISTAANNKTVNLLGFKKPSESDIVVGNVEKPEREPVEDAQDDATDTVETVEPTPPVTDVVQDAPKNDNPFVNATGPIDISDDDLPF